MTEPKPEGYIYKAIPKGSKQAIAKSAQARVTQTTKSALQWYLEQYLNPNGVYRRQLQLTADFAIQYELRVSASYAEDDPTVYELQLARYWGELRQKLPCVIIADAGFNYVNPGLGGISGSRIMSSTTSSVALKMDCEIPMRLSIATMDETTCQDLRDILVYIFGPLTNVNKSHLIYSKRPEDSWEVRLPLNFELEGLENRKVTEDNKDILWTTGVELTTEFEGTITIAFDKQVQDGLYQIYEQHEGEIPQGMIVEGQIVPIVGGPTTTITVPDTIYINQPTLISSPYMLAEAYFTSDDPKIALIDGYKILPRKPGTFNLYLRDKRSDEIIQSWEVAVKIQ